MTIAKESILIDASRKKIWTLWSDVPGWSRWDSDVVWAKLDGPFTKGSTGVLKPKGGPKANFTITECTKESSFSDVTSLPLATLTFLHTMESVQSKVKVTHTIMMDGPLTFLFSKLLGPSMKKGLPHALTQLKAHAERVK